MNSVPVLHRSLLAHPSFLLDLVKHFDHVPKVGHKVDEVDCPLVYFHPFLILLRVHTSKRLQVRLALETWGRNGKILQNFVSSYVQCTLLTKWARARLPDFKYEIGVVRVGCFVLLSSFTGSRYCFNPCIRARSAS
jgi:hypothetical protein